MLTLLCFSHLLDKNQTSKQTIKQINKNLLDAQPSDRPISWAWNPNPKQIFHFFKLFLNHSAKTYTLY